MSSEPRPKVTCFDCGKMVNKQKTHDFLKKLNDEFYTVKIFKCPECNSDTYSLTKSNWKPKNLPDNREQTVKLATEDTTGR